LSLRAFVDAHSFSPLVGPLLVFIAVGLKAAFLLILLPGSPVEAELCVAAIFRAQFNALVHLTRLVCGVPNLADVTPRGTLILATLPDKLGGTAGGDAFLLASHVLEGVALFTALRVEDDFSAVATLLLLDPGVVSFFVGALVDWFDDYWYDWFDDYWFDWFNYFGHIGLGDDYNAGRVSTLVLAFVKRFILLLALLFEARVFFDGPKLCSRLARILHTLVEFVGPFFVWFGT